MAFDQMKMLNDLRKAQKQLAKEIVEVEAGEGAVVVQVSAELKIVSVKINPEMVDLEDISDQSSQWLSTNADTGTLAQRLRKRLEHRLLLQYQTSTSHPHLLKAFHQTIMAEELQYHHQHLFQTE